LFKGLIQAYKLQVFDNMNYWLKSSN